MMVNGIDFCEKYAKSVSEEAFVKTFERASWNRSGSSNETLKEVWKKVNGATPKQEVAPKQEATPAPSKK